MKGGAQAALAIGVGYILGRRKMRLATMLAVGAAAGGIGGLGPAAARRGAKYVGSAIGSTDIAGALGPQIGEIVDTVRGELLDAAKVAAASAVTSRIDSLSDSLHERVETLVNPEAAVGRAGEAAGEAGETVGRAGRTAGRAGQRLGRLGRRGGATDDEEASDLGGEQDEDVRGNGEARRDGPRGRSERAEPDEPQEEDDEPRDEDDELRDEDEPDGEEDDFDERDVEPVRSRRRTSRSPVTRTRR